MKCITNGIFFYLYYGPSVLGCIKHLLSCVPFILMSTMNYAFMRVPFFSKVYYHGIESIVFDVSSC